MRIVIGFVVVLATGCTSEPIQNADLTGEPATVRTITTSMPLTSNGRLGGVAVGPDGAVHVSNFDRHVWRVGPDGRTILVSDQIQGSSGNTVDAEGRLLQASFVGGRVLAFDADGAMSIVAEGLEGPVGLTIDAAGELVVCNCQGNSLSVVSADGVVRTLAAGPLFACPNGITRGPDGALYVVNFNNPHVLRVDAGGEVAVLTTLSGRGNAHIAYAAGALYVSRIESHEVVRVTLNGSFARWAGTGEPGLTDGPVGQATLAYPNGIAAASDGQSVFVDTLDGVWRGDEPARLVLRQIGPLPPGDAPVPALPPRADVTSTEIRVGDFVFDALAAGPSDGKLVLLLHGFPQTADAFRLQLEALGGAGYRAVAPNQRGYSARARPDGVAPYAVSELVADVVGMADALGADTFHLVGHDWGGAVAWVTALRHAGRVRSLTVLSTPHFSALSAARASASSDQGARSSYFSTFAEPGADAALLANDAAGLRRIYSGLDADVVERYVEAFSEPGALRAALAWYAAAFGGTSATSQVPTAATPATPPPPIRVPTLYVWSTGDGAFGRDAALSTAGFIDAPYRFEVVDQVGHWLPELVPDLVARLILEHLDGR